MPQSKTSIIFKKNSYILLIPFVFILGIITVRDYLSNTHNNSNTVTDKSPVLSKNVSGFKSADIKIDHLQLRVEIADTEQSRETGLSYREKLEENTGMLFVFNNPTVAFFWMKDMKFPLDMIWIKYDKIVGINSNVPIPKPDTPLNQLPKYSPKEKVNYVLETNAGFVDKNNIRVGDSVEIKY